MNIGYELNMVYDFHFSKFYKPVSVVDGCVVVKIGVNVASVTGREVAMVVLGY